MIPNEMTKQTLAPQEACPQISYPHKTASHIATWRTEVVNPNRTKLSRRGLRDVVTYQNRLKTGFIILMSTLVLAACAGGGSHTTGFGESCEFCGHRHTAVTDDLFFLEYVHTSKGAKHEESINTVKARGQELCVEKGFTQSRFAQEQLLNLMKISSPYRDNFVEIYQGHAKASAHILCTGTTALLQRAGAYLMKCNADRHCLSVDDDVRFPSLHSDDVVKFDLEFRALADRAGDGYEHSVVVFDDESIQQQSAQVISGARLFSVDFKFSSVGLIKNIQPASHGLTMPHGQLGSFNGWIIARASNSTSPWFYVSYQPSADALRLLVAVTRLSSEGYNEFRQRTQN